MGLPARLQVSFVFLGIYPLAAAFGSWTRRPRTQGEVLNPFNDAPWPWAGTMAAGIFVMTWITLQMLHAGYVHPVQLLHLVWGLPIAALGAVPNVRAYCARGR
jgi:hypothetical protein